jgi:ribonuclease D
MTHAPVIRDRAGVEDLAARCAAAGRAAIDFEFLWERTYRPVACLAQVATDDEVVIVDPIAGADLEPLAALVADPAVETVMHAPSADLTLLSLHFGVRPQRLLDVQLVAGFVGLGAGQSLGTLLDRVLHVRLAKAESYSDWSRRPLTEAQLEYAADDVRHLLALSDRLAERVTELGRADWVAQEHALRYGETARFQTEPEEAWRRIKGQGRLTGRERAVLREVAAWREREASRRDRPPAWILADRVAVEIARRRPADRAALEHIRGLDGKVREREAQEILRAVRAGAELPPVGLGPSPPADAAERIGVLVSLGQILVAVRAEAAHLAPVLVATREEVEAYLASVVRADDRVHPLASGWRRDLAGGDLEALAGGHLALAPSPDPPYIEVIDRRR